MQDINIGDKVTITETMTPGEVIKVDYYNVVVVDEEGNQHVLSKNGVTPRSFLTESK